MHRWSCLLSNLPKRWLKFIWCDAHAGARRACIDLMLEEKVRMSGLNSSKETSSSWGSNILHHGSEQQAILPIYFLSISLEVDVSSKCLNSVDFSSLLVADKARDNCQVVRFLKQARQMSMTKVVFSGFRRPFKDFLLLHESSKF